MSKNEDLKQRRRSSTGMSKSEDLKQRIADAIRTGKTTQARRGGMRKSREGYIGQSDPVFCKRYAVQINFHQPPRPDDDFDVWIRLPTPISFYCLPDFSRTPQTMFSFCRSGLETHKSALARNTGPKCLTYSRICKL